MATALKHKLSYHRRLFLLLLVFSWTLVGVSSPFQYGREKHFKAERLDAQLQLFNLRMLDAVNAGAPPTTPSSPLLPHSCGRSARDAIDPTGGVVFDNSLDRPARTTFIAPRVAEALARGTGYTIRRHSESTDRNYFYSACRATATSSVRPYPTPCRCVNPGPPTANSSGSCCATLLMSVAGYFSTRRWASITRLNGIRQTGRAGGERIDDLPAFPHDELGEISSHIIRLYARLQKNHCRPRPRARPRAARGTGENTHQETAHQQHQPRAEDPRGGDSGAIWKHCWPTRRSTRKDARTSWKKAPHRPSVSGVCWPTSRPSRAWTRASQLIQKERVVLNDLIAEVTADMELKPADQRLRMNIDFPQQVEIVGSPSLLASIFRNLADNAAAYSGGRDIFIRLLSDTPEECTVSFADNGIGIGEHLPHIFRTLYRIDKGRSRKQGGTGRGLAIVKKRRYGSTALITAANANAAGLEFVFTLKKHS